jgi:hypothetical protein
MSSSRAGNICFTGKRRNAAEEEACIGCWCQRVEYKMHYKKLQINGVIAVDASMHDMHNSNICPIVSISNSKKTDKTNVPYFKITLLKTNKQITKEK